MVQLPFLNKKKKQEAETGETGFADVKKVEQMMGGQMPEITDEMIDQLMEGSLPGMPKLGRMQKMALKGLKKMSPEKRAEVFAKAMTQGGDGEGGLGNKEEMLQQVEEMRAAGQINSKQYKIALKRIKAM